MPGEGSLLKAPYSIFTIKNLLRHYAKWLNGDLNKKKVLVGAFSGHCETLRRILDSSSQVAAPAGGWLAGSRRCDWLVGWNWENFWQHFQNLKSLLHFDDDINVSCCIFACNWCRAPPLPVATFLSTLDRRKVHSYFISHFKQHS